MISDLIARVQPSDVCSQSWDPARVAAAVPAGIGFLGGAAVWKAVVEKGQKGEVGAVCYHGMRETSTMRVHLFYGFLTSSRTQRARWASSYTGMRRAK